MRVRPAPTLGADGSAVSAMDASGASLVGTARGGAAGEWPKKINGTPDSDRARPLSRRATR